MESFSSLMEFAVALAGFSGITMVVQARDAVVNDVQTFRNANLIAFALAAAFGSLIPEACAHLGATESQIWIWSSATFGILCGVLLILPVAARQSMSLESRRALSKTIWIGSVGGTVVVAFLQFMNAAGVLGAPGSAPIYLGIVWMISLAALMYARMLFAVNHLPST